MSRTPRLAELLLGNLCIGAGALTTLSSANSTFAAAKWTSTETGWVVMAQNLAYLVCVGIGGRLADRWGRARTAVVGASLAALGAALAMTGSAAATAAGVIVVFGGISMFFPGNAGLISDAGSATGSGPAAPLHVKVSRYNLGWSAGNLTGFAIALGMALAGYPLACSFAIAAALFAAMALRYLPWWNLPTRPPPPEGDRAPVPEGQAFTFLGRTSLALYACASIVLLGLTEVVLSRQVGAEQARSWASAMLCVYAASYLSGFVVLGWWSGWIMRPWKLTALQAGLGVLAMVCIVTGAAPSLPWMMVGAVAAGIGYSAAYTSSIYYSLRDPANPGAAASRHEQYLGAGSMVGPLVAPWFMGLIGGSAPGLVGFGWYLAAVLAVLLLWQAIRIPPILRRVRAAA